MRQQLAAAMLLVGVVAGADPSLVGRTIRPIALEDQHGQMGAVDASTRVVILTRDMDGGSVLKAAFTGIEPVFLGTRRAVCVADISEMPALVSRIFAVPRMRSRPYRVLLDRDGAATRELPRAPGKVVLVSLEDLQITRVVDAGTADEVRRALE